MKFKDFVGIDVSKHTLDVFILNVKVHKQFKNERLGFQQLEQWVQRQTCLALSDLLLCFEHTGLYSLSLAQFLEEKRVLYAMVPALEIKRSMGITRGKNDRIDSRRIAEFAFRFLDKIRLTTLPAKEILNIQHMLNLRECMARNLAGYIVSKHEIRSVFHAEELPHMFSCYDTMICTLKHEIKLLEKSIREILHGNKELWTTFELITTIKGIGLIVASHLIVYTCNFTRFDNWRKFACYSGTAPFEYQSGTSVRGRTQVSQIANQQMKKLLHLAAICAIHTDTEIRAYYQRRLDEGKSRMTVINIVRNKLLARVFAVAKRGTPFVDIKKYVA